MNNFLSYYIPMQMESQKIIVLQAIQDDILEGNESYRILLVSTDNTEISPINGKYKYKPARYKISVSNIIIYKVTLCVFLYHTGS